MMEERREHLESLLMEVCGNYGNDCSKCPNQPECKEYCRLTGIYEIVYGDKGEEK